MPTKDLMHGIRLDVGHPPRASIWLQRTATLNAIHVCGLADANAAGPIPMTRALAEGLVIMSSPILRVTPTQARARRSPLAPHQPRMQGFPYRPRAVGHRT